MRSPQAAWHMAETEEEIKKNSADSDRLHAALMNSAIGDELDLFIEKIQQEGNLTAGDNQLIEIVTNLRYKFYHVSSIQELLSLIQEIYKAVEGVNSKYMGYLVGRLYKLEMAVNRLFKDKATVVSKREVYAMVRDIFGQVQNSGAPAGYRGQGDSYQTFPIGNQGASSKPFSSNIIDRKEMNKGESPRTEPMKGDAVVEPVEAMDNQFHEIHESLQGVRTKIYEMYGVADNYRGELDNKVKLNNELGRVLRRTDQLLELVAQLHSFIARKL
jgi:hypothetical protein